MQVSSKASEHVLTDDPAAMKLKMNESLNIFLQIGKRRQMTHVAPAMSGCRRLKGVEFKSEMLKDEK